VVDAVIERDAVDNGAELFDLRARPRGAERVVDQPYARAGRDVVTRSVVENFGRREQRKIAAVEFRRMDGWAVDDELSFS